MPNPIVSITAQTIKSQVGKIVSDGAPIHKAIHFSNSKNKNAIGKKMFSNSRRHRANTSHARHKPPKIRRQAATPPKLR